MENNRLAGLDDNESIPIKIMNQAMDDVLSKIMKQILKREEITKEDVKRLTIGHSPR